MRHIILYLIVGSILLMYFLGDKKYISQSGSLIDKETSYTIRGVAALMIVVHHLMNKGHLAMPFSQMFDFLFGH